MSLDDRKNAFERQFANDQDTRFRIEARTCKLLGLWAAGQMGLSGTEADFYAKQVVAANLEEAGFDDVKRKIVPDLKAKNIDVSDHALDRQIEQCLEEATTQIMAQKKQV